MLAPPSPPYSLFPAALGWLLEDGTGRQSVADPFAKYSFGETTTADTPNSKDADVVSPAFSSQLELDEIINGDPAAKWSYPASTMKRKLSHNAYERDRRKKLNKLYSSLRSLLPETDQHKKLSIPSTVSRFLQYIPELQRHVERLTRRKEEIMSRISRRGDEDRRAGAGGDGRCGGGGAYPIISAASVNEREVMIQICLLSRITPRPLSKVLKYLEEGEGLRLVNASIFEIDADRAFYNLHLQAKDAASNDIDLQMFSKILAR